ncbi:ATP-binding protein [Azospirillum sp. ST 5-10]|uniref:PAS domain-containing hybrid sensor histidine kinase/response regulator n=1 Tax=unclassified Azospirillum TaxID=2630922 RepID=UPI003F4A7C98
MSALPTADPAHAATEPEALAEILEAAGAGIAVTDPSRPGNPLVYCNRAFRAMTGYDDGELIGRSPRILHGPGTDPATAGDLEAAALAGRPTAAEILHHRKDGTPFWNAVTLRPLRAPDGTVRRCIVSCSDVTDRRRSEEALRDAQEQLTRLAAETFALAEDLDRAREDAEAARLAAENASRAKSRFLAMMSHELRTPMTGVIGMGDLLLQTGLSDAQRGMVATLQRSADALLTILNDVLDFSKIEAGQLTLEEIEFSLARLLDDVSQLFLGHAAAKGLTLSTAIADGTPTDLRGDPTRLRQILFNLVGNAVKFTDHGHVEVRVRCAPDGGGPETVTLCFEVSDTGIGMTPDQQARLFHPFVQADASTTRKYGGTGLGLAICQRLVETMGGGIAAASTPGRGSAFRFSVRLRPVSAPPPRRDAHTPAPTVRPDAAARPRLLLAEDNDVNRMLVTTMLTGMGYPIDAVPDGQAALQALQDAAYDLLLLDMEMPVLDGGATARAIRGSPDPLSRLPIVGLSADALPEHRDRHMANGLDAYLTKPVDWKRLDAVIRELTSRPRRMTGPAAPGGSAEPADGGFAAIPLVDRVKLAELRVALGGAGLAGMLRLMPQTAEREIRAIRLALHDDRPGAIKAAAHTLVGLAANFGAPRLTAVARAVEDGHAHAGRVSALLPLLEAAAADTDRALGAYDDATAKG